MPRKELLIGCGVRREKQVKLKDTKEWSGLVTLDLNPDVNPDVVHDLEVLPYPFEDSEFDEIHAYEVLEHTGRQGDWRFFFDQFYEFWRILKPGGYLFGTTPAWDSIWAWADPGHTRVLSEASFIFLNKEEYELQIGKTAMTDYRSYWRGDFDLVAYNYTDEQFGFVIQARK